jgi:hypothetical protein
LSTEISTGELRLLASQTLIFLWFGAGLTAINLMKSNKMGRRQGPLKPVYDKDGKLKPIEENGTRPNFEVDKNWYR